MKVWKVILATLVIFAAGVVTGGLTVRLRTPEQLPVPASMGFGPLRQRSDLVDRMQTQLYLSLDQRQRIEAILHENHDRMKQLWDSIAPQAQEEHRRVRERIRAELNPEQQNRFEEMLRHGPTRGFEDRRRREEHRDPRYYRSNSAAASSSTNQRAKPVPAR